MKAIVSRITAAAASLAALAAPLQAQTWPTSWWTWWGGTTTTTPTTTTHSSVPEIDASTGILAIAAVLAVLAFVWERRRRAS